MLWIILIIVAVIVIALIAMYNSLVTLRLRVKNAWSQIDVQLQRRFDLIPNLVETVKGYMTHESEVLTKVTDLRSAWANATTVDEKAKLDKELSESLKTIMAVAENYPNLKANEQFLYLQKTLSKMENQLQAARRIYNIDVTKYNTYVYSFPSSIVASLFHFKEAELFEADASANENPKVS